MSSPNQPNVLELTEDQLRNKEDQHWEMAGLARQDGDKVDAARHTTLAKMYAAELAEREGHHELSRAKGLRAVADQDLRRALVLRAWLSANRGEMRAKAIESFRKELIEAAAKWKVS
jgi:hypothetical protein